MKTEDLIWEFIYDCEVRKLSPKTIRGYKNHLLYFNKFLLREGVQMFEDVSVRYIKAYLKSQNSKGLKTAYLNGCIKVLKVFYKWTIREGYSKSSGNPMDRIQYIRGDKTLILTFTDDEVKKMMDVYKGFDFLQVRNKAILAMLFDTGIRNNELCELSANAVKENYILVWGKGRKERVVPKSSYLAKALKRYDNAKASYFEFRNSDPDFYFLSRNGKQLTTASVERVVQLAGKQVGVRDEIRCSPHTCRHYFAQTQVLNGNDLYTISRLLGHSNISITKTYIQSMKDDEVICKSLEYSPLMNLGKRKSMQA